jgi:inner membrane transporter RhtA
VLPYTLELLALRRMPTSTFAVLMSLGPAIAALAGYLVLDQALAPVQLLAIGLVIAASAGAVHTSNKSTSATCTGRLLIRRVAAAPTVRTAAVTTSSASAPSCTPSD